MPPETRPEAAAQDAISRGRARPTVHRRPPRAFALWGVLLAVGGVVAWGSIVRDRPEVADLWKPLSPPTEASLQMTSTIRDLGDAPPLLRLEWPEHPTAVEYRIRFRVEGQPGPAPLAIQSPVFLYDLESDVLGLPDEFDWEVAAVLKDGSEVVSPWRHYPER